MELTDNAYLAQLKKLGLASIKADAPEPFCKQCQDLGTYEVFYFESREQPIYGLQEVYRVMGLGWQSKKHMSEAHRCKQCYPRFEKKHNKIVETIKNASNKVDELFAKAELAKHWGRGVAKG